MINPYKNKTGKTPKNKPKKCLKLARLQIKYSKTVNPKMPSNATL